MKIIMVHIGALSKYPPVLSALETLSNLGEDIVFCGTDIDTITEKYCNDRNIATISIRANYEKAINPVMKLPRLLHIRHRIWEAIDSIYGANTVLWVFSDLALKHLGGKLLRYKFVLHMFELAQSTLFYRKFPLFRMNTATYAKRAVGVVQAEYNRAQISKAWWNLDKLPYVIPNKPSYGLSVEKSAAICDEEAKRVISSFGQRKIILYQGLVTQERPLKPFVDAVNKLGDEYVLVIMSGSAAANQYRECTRTFVIPFIAPPLHLQVTSHAHIGILSYVPTKNEYSVLNSIYCAPNKIYEYSRFGIPMIGNEIPGLRYTLVTERMGICVGDFTVGSITEAVRQIELEYSDYSANAKKFYDKQDLGSLYADILGDLRVQLTHEGLEREKR